MDRHATSPGLLVWSGWWILPPSLRPHHTCTRHAMTGQLAVHVVAFTWHTDIHQIVADCVTHKQWRRMILTGQLQSMASLLAF